MKSKPKTFAAGADNSFVLNTAPVGIKIVIDFTASRDFTVEPSVLGLALVSKECAATVKFRYATKIVVNKVAHWYQPQKYTMRIIGAEALKPYSE